MKGQVKNIVKLIGRRFTFIVLVFVFLSSVLSTIYTLVEFNFSIKPELLEKAHVIAKVIHDDVDLAISSGIPLRKIRGMDDYLNDYLVKYQELTFIAIVEKGESLFQAGNVEGISYSDNESFEKKYKIYSNSSLMERLYVSMMELPNILAYLVDGGNKKSDIFKISLKSNEDNSRAVFVGLDAGYIQYKFIEVFSDIAIMLVAVLLVCFEVSIIMVRSYTSQLLEERK